MNKGKLKTIENEVKETLLSKERYRWFTAIGKHIKQGMTVVNACKVEHVPRSEYYYWKRRVDEILFCMRPGVKIRPSMFRALSKKPHFSPNQISDELKRKIIRIRKKTNTGPENIRYFLIKNYGITLSVTGIHKALKREGLIKERIYHRKKKTPLIKREYFPGEKVQIDTKYVKSMKGKTHYQYSAIDLATGIIYKQLFKTIDPTSSCTFLRNVITYMPFNIKIIQTDNGFEYTWRLNPAIRKIHPFTLQCKLMQLDHVLIPPASPTFNSHVERTHRVDKEELWSKKRYKSLQSMKKDLKKYVQHYNYSRATKSKNWLTPVEHAKDKFGLKFSRLRYCVSDV